MTNTARVLQARAMFGSGIPAGCLVMALPSQAAPAGKGRIGPRPRSGVDQDDRFGGPLIGLAGRAGGLTAGGKKGWLEIAPSAYSDVIPRDASVRASRRPVDARPLSVWNSIKASFVFPPRLPSIGPGS